MKKYLLIVHVVVLLMIYSSFSVYARDGKDPTYVVETCSMERRQYQEHQAGTDLNEKPTHTPSQVRYKWLSFMAKHLANKGYKVILAMPPDESLLSLGIHDEGFHIALRDYLNTLDEFRNAGFIVPHYEKIYTIANINGSPRFYFKRDSDWTSYGAKFTAELISSELDSLNVIDKSSAVNFVTRRVGWLKNRGHFINSSSDPCYGNYAPEFTELFNTTPVTDNSIPNSNVFLIGTGRSVANTYNFDGFLKEKLKTNITNYTNDDGDIVTGWYNFLFSLKKDLDARGLIVWELPYEKRELSSSFFRSVLAGLYSDCESKHILNTSGVFSGLHFEKRYEMFLTKNISLNEKEDLLFNIGFVGPYINGVTVRLWFDDGGYFDVKMKSHIRSNDLKFILGNAMYKYKKNIFAIDVKLTDSKEKDMFANVNVCLIDVN